MEIIESRGPVRERFIDVLRRYFGPNVYDSSDREGGMDQRRLLLEEYVRRGFFGRAVRHRYIIMLETHDGELFGRGGVFKDIDIHVFYVEHFQRAVQFAEAYEEITQKRVRLIKAWT